VASTLEQLAELVKGKVIGDASVSIETVATLETAQAGQISFLTSAAYKPFLATTSASAVIVKEYDEKANTNLLVVDDPHAAYAKIAQCLYPRKKYPGGVDASASVHSSCKIHSSASIGPNVVIEEGVEIGEGVCIKANCFVGRDVHIGDNSFIYPNVTILHEVEIGQRCIVHSGTVIGSDGFGYAYEAEGWLKIPQVGTVIVGNDVEIGANTAIDRGAIENTVIADGVKLDNQIHIAHNVRIGENSVVAASCGFAGSTTVGKNCMFGGMVATSGHIELADGVVIMGHSSVTKTIKEAGSYSSTLPVSPAHEWRRHVGRFKRLDGLTKRVAKCEAQLKKDSREPKSEEGKD